MRRDDPTSLCCDAHVRRKFRRCGSRGRQAPARRYHRLSGAVQKSLHRAIAECKNEGGEDVTFAPNTVQALDLAKGRAGYIVNFNETECKGRDGVYCASGGCDLDSGRKGRPALATPIRFRSADPRSGVTRYGRSKDLHETM